jgi:hypothetical protein
MTLLDFRHFIYSLDELLSSTLSSNLSEIVSSLHLIHLKELSDQENSRNLAQHEKLQDRKLFHLGVEYTKQTIVDPNKMIFNHSSKTLTDFEKSVLAKGLNFSIPLRRLKYSDFLLSFELLHKHVENETISFGSRHTKETVKTKLKDIALSGYHSYLPPQSCFSMEEFKKISRKIILFIFECQLNFECQVTFE